MDGWIDGWNVDGWLVTLHLYVHIGVVRYCQAMYDIGSSTALYCAAVSQAAVRYCNTSAPTPDIGVY